MKKKLLCILAAMLLPLILGGCAMLDKEYVSIHDYIPSEQEVKAAGGELYRTRRRRRQISPFEHGL